MQYKKGCTAHETMFSTSQAHRRLVLDGAVCLTDSFLIYDIALYETESLQTRMSKFEQNRSR